MEPTLVWIALTSGFIVSAQPYTANQISHFETEAQCLAFAQSVTRTDPEKQVTCAKGYAGQKVIEKQLEFRRLWKDFIQPPQATSPPQSEPRTEEERQAWFRNQYDQINAIQMMILGEMQRSQEIQRSQAERRARGLTP